MRKVILFCVAILISSGAVAQYDYQQNLGLEQADRQARIKDMQTEAESQRSIQQSQQNFQNMQQQQQLQNIQFQQQQILQNQQR